ncbi:helix-turn-helix domain-containing protein [Rhodococcus ruber]|uniref:helix-turn-helix transcriptional regulator n=1 Tax=Rhodococcus ruber TaxID=1830 RepID=UPI0026580F61|nr:helix-turn-helix domain-containing protein [Rhodococcus ruber]WKK13875.1 helix-turn-helix domain-containing protein [Rhodococcus ruber]
MQPSTDYLLTRREVADRLKLPVKTLATWASTGKGPRFARIGKYARYRLSDVIAWEDEQFTGGGAE